MNESDFSRKAEDLIREYLGCRREKAALATEFKTRMENICQTIKWYEEQIAALPLTSSNGG